MWLTSSVSSIRVGIDKFESSSRLAWVGIKMAGSVNKAILVGNLGRDPEVRTFASGAKYCNLSVATSDRWQDRSTGETRERTEWHRVTIYSENTVRFAEQYLRKGSCVYVEGKIETRKWQDPQTGQDRYSTEIAVRPFGGQLTSVGRRDDADFDQSRSDQGGWGSSYSDNHYRKQDSIDRADRSQGFDDDMDQDDEIPF